MKKFLLIIGLFFFFSCQSIENKGNLSNEKIHSIRSEIVKKQELIKNMAKLNKIEEIKKNVVSTFKNNLIISQLAKYNLSKAIIIFSDEIEIISETKAKNIILINLGLESIYLNINWEYNGSEWKIKSVESHE